MVDDADEPEVYTKGKAVLRVYNRVGGSLGTAWLIGDEGHILTNWHVIETEAEAVGADFEAMAESSTCEPKCDTQFGKSLFVFRLLKLRNEELNDVILCRSHRTMFLGRKTEHLS